jgi:hypothetical protein
VNLVDDRVRRQWRALRRALRATALALAVLLGGLAGALYATSSLYDLPAAAPFAGPAWYNPYAALDSAPARWLQANFHAHSTAWGGATEGDQSPAAVVGAYRALGYDVIALSNYHALPPLADSSVFPVYEHGWNVRKSHRLVIGAREVLWRDYPFGQHVQHQQDLIDRARAGGAVVAIAHPAMRDGHPVAAFGALAGYDALEVLNHFLPPAEAHWDMALSSGRAAWILANDDTHDIRLSGETGVHWTLVHAASPSVAAVTAAIRAGRTIGVRGRAGRTALAFAGLVMHGDTLELRVRGPVDSVRVVGQGGAVRLAVPGAALPRRGDTLVVRAVARPEDGYLRAVVVGAEASARAGVPSALFLNPVVRWDGRTRGVAAATLSVPRTTSFRLSVAGLLTVVAAPHVARLGSARARRRRTTVPAT